MVNYDYLLLKLLNVIITYELITCYFFYPKISVNYLLPINT